MITTPIAPSANRAPSAVALCSLLAVLLSGCAQKPLCPELGNCGGPEPIGDWVLAPGYPSCMEDLYLPQTDTRLAQNNKTPALVSPPEPAVYDWCDLLVTGGGPMVQLRQPAFFYESGQIGTAEIRIQKDHTFTSGITRTGTFVLDFPAACVREFGAQDGRPINPADPMSPVGTVCEQLQPQVAMSGLGEGSYRNVYCAPSQSDPGGCLCRFDVTETGGPGGYWSAEGNIVTFLPQTNFPSKMTYCNRGTSLELTGANGDYIFGIKGLRTFRMKPIAQ